ncbi:hypothetical protein [Pseudoalteromonas sp. M8]|nr:hypothetical protein [Pseudoalteromonas sp. M8]QUI71752.1 hypothetical protein GSF13_19315 [Pseudoalteromonas sp. M8]
MTTLATLQQPNLGIPKLALSLVGAVIITFATFGFMQNLVSQELTPPLST